MPDCAVVSLGQDDGLPFKMVKCWMETEMETDRYRENKISTGKQSKQGKNTNKRKNKGGGSHTAMAEMHS